MAKYLLAGLLAAADVRYLYVMSVMNEANTQCINCGRRILQRTADRNHGLCAPCQKAAEAIPPLEFETPHDVAQRLASMDEDPEGFRVMAWQSGAAFVHGYIDRLAQREEMYLKWSPRLREFADECRKSRPIPDDFSQTSSHRAKQGIYAAEFECTRFSSRTVPICCMPLSAMPVAQRVWSKEQEQPVLLTPEEVSHWEEVYPYCDTGFGKNASFWWYAHFWWHLRDFSEQDSQVSPERQKTQWWYDDVPNGETPWVLSIGNSRGRLYGGMDQELWSWNGTRAKFIRKENCYIS